MEEVRKGKLTIFFGYCAGVGKTFSMLNTAQQKSVEGVDVVIGYIEKCETKINQNVQKKTNLKTSLNNLEKIE